mmetsp:Transcript_10832/g.21175  ORF Transcript_10832/g.21175 Transcript_10832/m.21175 type:complete len:92 (+) Transcript_10832:3352-3627(+)
MSKGSHSKSVKPLNLPAPEEILTILQRDREDRLKKNRENSAAITTDQENLASHEIEPLRTRETIPVKRGCMEALKFHLFRCCRTREEPRAA